MRALRIIAGLFAISSSAYAEQGCPPGQIPYAGTSMQSCGPAPRTYNAHSSTQNQPQGHYIDHWQAIAGDNDMGILGTSDAKLSNSDAAAGALQDCTRQGGRACLVKEVVRNGCIALATGDDIASFRGGPTKDEAESDALKSCGKDSSKCAIYYSHCDPASLVR